MIDEIEIQKTENQRQSQTVFNNQFHQLSHEVQKVFYAQ